MKLFPKSVAVAVVAAAVLSGRVYANDTQRLIFDAGNNLGLWAAQVELFDTPAADPAMIAYATNAFNAVARVRELIRPPFTNLDLQSVLDKISRYPNDTAGWNAGHRAGYVRQIFDLFLSRLSVLYLSTRGIYSSPNCDAAFLRVGYHLGRAQMGAFARNSHVVSEARAGLLQAVQVGLQLSRDIGCGFNVEAAWGALRIDRAMSLADFQALVNPVRQISFDAAQMFSEAYPISPSWPEQETPPPPPPAGQSLEGLWRSGATQDIIRFERQGNVVRGTFAAIGRSTTFRVGDVMGEFTQTGADTYSGKVAFRQPDGSTSWLEGVVIRVQGNTATATAPWWNAAVTYTRQNP